MYISFYRSHLKLLVPLQFLNIFANKETEFRTMNNKTPFTYCVTCYILRVLNYRMGKRLVSCWSSVRWQDKWIALLIDNRYVSWIGYIDTLQQWCVTNRFISRWVSKPELSVVVNAEEKTARENLKFCRSITWVRATVKSYVSISKRN